MRVSLDPVSLVILAGVVVGLFVAAIILLGRRTGLRTRLFLGGFVAAYSIGNLGSVWGHAGLLRDFPHLLGTGMPAIFLIGPCLFLYILSLTRPGFRFGRRDALHFLPFGIHLVLSTLLLYARGAAYKLGLIQAMLAGHMPLGFRIYYDLRIPYVLGYLLLCAVALKRYARTVPDNFSAIERVGLRWLRLLVWAYATAVAALLIIARLDVNDVPLHVYSTVVILLIGIRGMTQPEVFARRPGTAAAREAALPAPPPAKYEKSSLSPGQAAEAEKMLVAVMENDRLFLEDDLSLAGLAAKVGLPPGHVSQVINERLKKNFFDFVNGYRVEEAKRLLRDPRRRGQKILAIAFDAGFNTKVAFNRVFKKYTGITPSEFKAHAADAPAGPAAHA